MTTVVLDATINFDADVKKRLHVTQCENRFRRCGQCKPEGAVAIAMDYAWKPPWEHVLRVYCRRGHF